MTWPVNRCADQLFVSAEFRGPGVHHNYEDSDSGYEMDADNRGKTFGVGGSRGRIIFLGDGTEVLTGSDDTEMFDNADEDKDLESQVSKPSASSDDADEASTTTTDTAATSTGTGADSAAETKPEESAAPQSAETMETDATPASSEQDKKTDGAASEEVKKD